MATIEITNGRKMIVRTAVFPTNHSALSATAKTKARITVMGTVATPKMSVLRNE